MCGNGAGIGRVITRATRKPTRMDQTVAQLEWAEAEIGTSTPSTVVIPTAMAILQRTPPQTLGFAARCRFLEALLVVSAFATERIWSFRPATP